MGWLDIKLDMTTMVVGAMVIGISVDDTIHFMHKFQHYREQTGDTAAAVRETLSTTGAAMLITTLVLACGFFTITAGRFSNTQAMGLLAGVACIVAFACDVLLAPALMKVIGYREPKPGRPA
jgi:predicted RND superfamily exporter protein